jgi:hypothetical protein
MVRPSCEALSRSITTSVCGLSILRSVSTNMNMPLDRALSINVWDTSLSLSKGSVVPITNCTGRPLAPGRDGGWNATVWTPAIPPSSFCTIG